MHAVDVEGRREITGWLSSDYSDSVSARFSIVYIPRGHSVSTILHFGPLRPHIREREGNVLFNDALNTFYLRHEVGI